MTSIEQDFGALVRWTLKAQGKSQTWLASTMNKHGMNVDASSISRLLAGTRATRLSEAVVIARVLHMDLNAFAEQEPERIDTIAPILVAELRALVERWEGKA